MRVLFVCTGNICRSPMAERLVELYASRSDGTRLDVSSAGTRAVIGHPIHEKAATVLRNVGASSSGFAARQLTASIATESDLVLTMTRQHRDAVLELAPALLRRTFTLSEFAHLYGETRLADASALSDMRSVGNLGGGYDIPDPIGGDAQQFERVGEQLRELLQKVLEFSER